MTEHTPGPWGYVIGEEAIEAVRDWGGVVLGGPDNEWDSGFVGNLVAVALGSAECEANTCLIAAAPDLLAACERALHLLEITGTGKLAATPAGDDLRAAIRMARGEEAIEATP